MQSDSLARHSVVLLGMGHTNAHVLRMWRQSPLDDAELICIAPAPIATYSGMLPGVLAGQYTERQMQLDLTRLCAAANATLVHEEVTGLELESRCVLFRDRPPLPFDVLSIGIGSIPNDDGVVLSTDAIVRIKPMVSFLERLAGSLRQAEQQRAITKPGEPLRVAVVGGGAGGLEILFCLPPFLKRVLNEANAARSGQVANRYSLLLIHGTGEVPGGFSAGIQKRVQRELKRRDVRVFAGSRVERIDGQRMVLENGQVVEADVIIWATHAAPPDLLARLPLPKDERGFLRVDASLRSTSGAPIFAVGDTASLQPPVLKAGVYAVREGPVLWENLARQLQRQPLRTYEPQRDFLRLLNLGDGRALGQWRGRSVEGRWVWRWKDRIDRRFMQMFDVDAMPTMGAESRAARSTNRAPTMRCVGCGGKIGSQVLHAVMKELKIPTRPEVLVGLDSPDDAAVLQFAADRCVAVTTDYFTSPVRDHYLAGRLTALHALSDAWAMGASPVAALATVVLPYGGFRAQQRVLRELLAGGLQELERAGATLVGGHTVEGPQVSLGFTILAQQARDEVTMKRQVALGDQLILTKPLGVGVLLAAYQEARCEASWWTPLVDAMLMSNGPAADVARRHGVRAMTDVTGFGLLGHLVEMLSPLDLSADVMLAQLPRLPGAETLWAEGRRSTMDEPNRAAFASFLQGHAETPKDVLFDPQTSGGLLLAVPGNRADGLLSELRACAPLAAVIGSVQSGPLRIQLR